MGFEVNHAYRKVSLLCDLTGSWTLEFWTELPNGVQRAVYSVSLAPTTGEMPLNIPLAGNVQGKTPKLRLRGGTAARVYGCKILAKPVGTLGGEGSAWVWYTVPIEVTPELYSRATLPIPGTPEAWAEAKLPIPGTPEGWAEAKLPIPGTPEAWSDVALPLRKSDVLFEWVDLPVDGVE
jgi:hypothetical protein